MAETEEEKKKRLADEASRKQVLPAPNPAEVKSKLPNATVGEQTRGAGGVRLDQQIAPAGKELIGMRSGVPIYADANDVYGGGAPASPVPQPAAAPAAATPTTSTAPSQSLQQMRDTYQTSQTATATRAQQAPRTNPYEPVNRGGFFSKEYAQQFKAAQAAANQRAIDRIGAPRQDLPTSTTTTSNAAASALRNAAAQPRVATAEQVRAAGFGPKETDRLLFTENLTPEDLESYGRTAANKRLRDRSIGNY
jgi:hypothetical protein